jgi:hypothetical protein
VTRASAWRPRAKLSLVLCLSALKPLCSHVSARPCTCPGAARTSRPWDSRRRRGGATRPAPPRARRASWTWRCSTCSRRRRRRPRRRRTRSRSRSPAGVGVSAVLRCGAATQRTSSAASSMRNCRRRQPQPRLSGRATHLIVGHAGQNAAVVCALRCGAREDEETRQEWRRVACRQLYSAHAAQYKRSAARTSDYSGAALSHAPVLYSALPAAPPS